MQNNQPVLLGVIIVLTILIGFLVYDNSREDTLGEKVGNTIDRAANDIDDALDGR